MRRWLCVLAAALVGCTSTPDVTSTASTTLPPPTTTSTPADRCDDVFCVVFRLDPEAEWSEGTRLTADDFAHTIEVARAAGDPAYDLVTGFELGDGEITIAFSEVTGAFFRLFPTVLPAHDSAVTSGAWVFEDGRLESATATVELVEVDGVRGSVTALQRGEVDLVWLIDPPSWAVADLAGIEGVTTAIGPGPDWEMVTFNQADALLAEEWVRRAITMALDRESMAEATVRAVDPDATVLDSTLAGIDTEPYPIMYDPVAARALLEENGCAAGDDGIRSCGGVRMSFDWVTTIGDPWRLTMAELASQSLEAIGIEVSVSTMVPSDLFDADHLFGENWDMVAFAWQAQLDPVAAADLYRCRGDGPHGFGTLNVGRHCGDDDLLTAAEASFDVGERVDLLRRVDRDILSAAAVVPLFARPIVSAWVDSVSGVEPGPFAHPLDLVEEWSGSTRLAVTAPPAAVGWLVSRGAFRPVPGGEYLPDLVIEFETLGG